MEEISRAGLYFEIANQKLWGDKNQSGKAVVIRNHHTNIVIDDSRAVCAECEAYGLLAYQVLNSKKKPKDKDIYRVRNPGFHKASTLLQFEHSYSESVEGAVLEILEDDNKLFDGRPILDWKLHILHTCRSW